MIQNVKTLTRSPARCEYNCDVRMVLHCFLLTRRDKHIKPPENIKMQERQIIQVGKNGQKTQASAGWRRLPGVGGAQTVRGSCGMDAWMMKMCSWSSLAVRCGCCEGLMLCCVTEAVRGAQTQKAVEGRRSALCARCCRCCWETTPPIDTHTHTHTAGAHAN